MTNQVDSIMDQLYANSGKYGAYLQGTDLGYSARLALVSMRVGINPYVSQTSVVSNLQKMIESGITYNLEFRAFLNTISENIADTFDAMDKSLLQIVRLQQADSSAARLGMEAYLT